MTFKLGKNTKLIFTSEVLRVLALFSGDTGIVGVGCFNGDFRILVGVTGGLDCNCVMVGVLGNDSEISSFTGLAFTSALSGSLTNISGIFFDESLLQQNNKRLPFEQCKHLNFKQEQQMRYKRLSVRGHHSTYKS